MSAIEYRWACITPQHSMITVEEAIYLGWEVVRRDGQVCGEWGLIPERGAITTTEGLFR